MTERCEDALKIMRDNDIRRLVVVKGKKVLGFVTERRLLLANFAQNKNKKGKGLGGYFALFLNANAPFFSSTTITALRSTFSARMIFDSSFSTFFWITRLMVWRRIVGQTRL